MGIRDPRAVCSYSLAGLCEALPAPQCVVLITGAAVKELGSICTYFPGLFCLLGVASCPVYPFAVDSWLLSFRSCLPSQVAVDMEFAKNMYELHKKVSPNELILGW